MGSISATVDLDIFTRAPIEKSVCETRLEIVPANIPLPNADLATPCEWRVPASMDCFTDLASTLLEIECKIQYNEQKDADKAIPETDEIALINNSLMSFFSSIQISLNNRTVVPNNYSLPWSAYIDCVNKYAPDVRLSWLGASGYSEEQESAGLTEQSKARFKPLFNSGTARFLGPIMHGYFRMTKYLIPGVEMGVTMTRSKPEFVLLYKEDPEKPKTFTVTLDRAYLHIYRKKLYPNVHSAMEHWLLKTPAIYEFADVVMKPIIVPANVFAVDALICDSAILPSRIDILQINQKAASGSVIYNPLLFQHYNIQSLALEKNGQLLQPPYQLDFSKDSYLRPYIDYFRTSGCGLEHGGSSIVTYQSYRSSFMIMSFALSHFPDCENTNMKTEPEHGSLRLKILYDSSKMRPIDDSIVIMCLLKYNREFFIDSNRAVTN